VCVCYMFLTGDSVFICCRGSQVINKIEFKESIKEVRLLCHIVQRCLYLLTLPHLTWDFFMIILILPNSTSNLCELQSVEQLNLSQLDGSSATD